MPRPEAPPGSGGYRLSVNEPELHPLQVRRLNRRQLVALDACAAALYTGVLLALSPGRDAPAALAWVMLLLTGLPPAVRRLWPVPVLALVTAASVVAVALKLPSGALLAPAYAVYPVALEARSRRWIPTPLIGTVSFLVLFVGPLAGPRDPMISSVGVLLFEVAVSGASWTLGRAVRDRRLHAARAARQLTDQAVADERLRIARELHDVVAHSMSLIAVKAGVAVHVAEARPQEALDALRVIEKTSRDALAEMRHLLGVLRTPTSSQDPPYPTVPQPNQIGSGPPQDQPPSGGETGPRNQPDTRIQPSKRPHSSLPHLVNDLQHQAAPGSEAPDQDPLQDRPRPKNPGQEPCQDRPGPATPHQGDLSKRSGSTNPGQGGLSDRAGAANPEQDELASQAGPANRRRGDLSKRSGSTNPGQGGLSDRPGVTNPGRGEPSDQSEDTEPHQGDLSSRPGSANPGQSELQDRLRSKDSGRSRLPDWLRPTTSSPGRLDDRKPGTAPPRTPLSLTEGELAPTPGVDRIPRLVDAAAMAGVRVDLRLDVGELPEGIALAIYRIVQEALTNIVKHAAPAQARVVVEQGEREVRVEVTDDGPGARVLPGATPGHGLIGMRERAMMYGGEFAAGPRPEGGFAVRARLPFDRSAS